MRIFGTVFPILVIVLAGYWVANRKHLSQSDCDSISKFVFNYLIPILLFSGAIHARIPENMQWEFLLSFYTALLFVYALSVILAKVIFRFSAYEQSVFSMGTSYSNATIVGIPVCIQALGEDALLPLLIIISIHNLILFTVGIFVAERDSLSFSSFLKNLIDIIKQLITSPITASLIIGGLVNIITIPIYQPLEEAITMMSKAAVPSALFILGASLNKYRIRGHIVPAMVIVIIKTILLPFLVWFLSFQVFTVSPLWASTAVLTSAMPVGISAYIFSQKYQVCENLIATSIVISTLASIFTLSVLLSYVQSII